MKQYRIYASPIGMTEVVKQGWSWPAFFFTVIWAMVKKMWALGVGLFGLFFVIGFIGGDAGGADVVVNLLSLVASVVFGIQGNAWREKNLIGRGFELVGTLNASNPEGALAMHLAAQA